MLGASAVRPRSANLERGASEPLAATQVSLVACPTVNAWIAIKTVLVTLQTDIATPMESRWHADYRNLIAA